MKIEVNLDTNLPNLRKQHEKMLRLRQEIDAALAVLNPAVEAAEAARARMAAVKPGPATVIKYPPWATTARLQESYRKQLRHLALLAERRAAKKATG